MFSTSLSSFYMLSGGLSLKPIRRLLLHQQPCRQPLISQRLLLPSVVRCTITPVALLLALHIATGALPRASTRIRQKPPPTYRTRTLAYHHCGPRPRREPALAWRH